MLRLSHVTLLNLTCLSVLLGGAAFHSTVMSSYSKQSSAASPHTVSRPPKKVPWLLCPLGTSAIGPAGRSEQTLPGLARSITLISSELYGFTTTIRLEVRPFEQPEPFDIFFHLLCSSLHLRTFRAPLLRGVAPAAVQPVELAGGVEDAVARVREECVPVAGGLRVAALGAGIVVPAGIELVNLIFFSFKATKFR